MAQVNYKVAKCYENGFDKMKIDINCVKLIVDIFHFIGNKVSFLEFSFILSIKNKLHKTGPKFEAITKIGFKLSPY